MAKRALAHWRLLISVVIGVLLASTIMAGTVIYFDALRELALRNTLGKFSPGELDILVQVDRSTASLDESRKVLGIVEPELDARLAWLLRDRVRGGRSITFFLSAPGGEDLAEESGERTYFAYLPRLQEHISLLPDGRLPRDGALNGAGEPLRLEAIVPRGEAEALGLSVGDRLSAVHFWTGVTQFAEVVVSGIFRRDDPDDEFWRLDDGILRAPTSGLFPTVPLFISERTFLHTLGPQFPLMGSTYGWLLAIDQERLNAGNTSAARDNIVFMESQLRPDFQRYRQITELDDALADYDRRLLFTKLQMFVVMILIAVVILYYVVTLSSLLVEEQRGEIALLRSRGATQNQILGVFVLEGATISLLAIVLAPLLAAGAVSLLGFTPAFSDLSGGSTLPVNISSAAYMMSALGGLLSFASLMIPAVEASRIGVTRHRQQSARPAQAPFFQRYYLDVLLLVVSVVLFRQLTQQGSVAARDLLGEVVVNQLLLAVPALLLLASAMVLLRLFPVAMSLGSRLLSPRVPPGVVLGLWQMARNPTHYARLSLLLILMAGLGIFAASFGGTLDRSFQERVLYSTGSDIRLEGVTLGSVGLSQPLVKSYERLPGVEKVSPALRGTGQDLTTRAGEDYVMFAIDPGSFADLAWYRNDFSDETLEALLSALVAPSPSEGKVFPDGARAIRVRVKPDRPRPSVALTARVRDTNDRYYTYVLGQLDFSEWKTLEANLFEGGAGSIRTRLFPARPLSLVSLGIHETNGAAGLLPGGVLIDDIRVRVATGEVYVIEEFDSVAGWNVLAVGPESSADLLERSEVGPDGAPGGTARFIWSGGRPLVTRGIYPGPTPEPLPVLASDSFVDNTGHSVGDSSEVSVSGHRVPVRLVGTVKYFPTLDTVDENFLVSNVASLTAYANLGALSTELTPNEIWLSTADDGPDRRELIERFEGDEPFAARVVHDRAARLDTSRVDPLVGAGWTALLFIAFGAILLLSTLGFLVHAYVSFRGRQLQFALLRTIGLSLRQLVILMGLEQALVIAVGMALGTWMGGRLAATIMPFLGHDEQGSQVLPPFAIEVDWATVAVTYSIMGLIFAAIILGVIWLIHRMSLQRILRLGEA